MNSAASSADSQKNLGIEFSRRARGIPIWAVLRSLGRDGVADLVDRHCRLARRLADGLAAAGYVILNDVELNQVLFRLQDDAATRRAHAIAIESGRLWFGPTVWQGRPALGMSVSSWQTTEEHVDRAIAVLAGAAAATGAGAVPAPA